MSYKAWLLMELVNDGIIEEEEYTVEDLDKDTLFETTELEEADFDNYAAQYAEYCKYNAVTPIWDFD